ncbi:MAG: hypothetical protein AAFX76_13990, partial [Planctomycetota bacterium]
MTSRPRVLILANRTKDRVRDAIDEFGPWLKERAEIVGVHNTRRADDPELDDGYGVAAEALPDADLA